MEEMLNISLGDFDFMVEKRKEGTPPCFNFDSINLNGLANFEPPHHTATFWLSVLLKYQIDKSYQHNINNLKTDSIVKTFVYSLKKFPSRSKDVI